MIRVSLLNLLVDGQVGVGGNTAAKSVRNTVTLN